MNANQLEERLLQYGVRCSLLCRELPIEWYDAKHVAGQLIRAATHPGFHYPEARSAESDRDFLHKLKVLLKELRESHAELKYIKYMRYFEPGKVDPLIQEANELVSIFIATTKKVSQKINKA
ncbi:MAG: four helix bundle protein [Bacteroidota bacterium]